MPPPNTPAIPGALDKGDFGAGHDLDQTSAILGGAPGSEDDDPAGGSEREPLPHHRDLPGQEIPDQDPDLEPIIGDDDLDGNDVQPDELPIDDSRTQI